MAHMPRKVSVAMIQLIRGRAADVTAQDVLYFLEEPGQVAAVTFGEDVDENPDHMAAVFHEIKGNHRYDEKFNDGPGNGKDRLDKVGNAVDAVIADFDEGVVDDLLDLVGNIELGLLIFKPASPEPPSG